jgi:hypothetical protein
LYQDILSEEDFLRYKKAFNKVKKSAKNDDKAKYSQVLAEFKSLKKELGIFEIERQRKIATLKQALKTTHKLVTCYSCKTKNLIGENKNHFTCKKCRKVVRL